VVAHQHCLILQDPLAIHRNHGDVDEGRNGFLPAGTEMRVAANTLARSSQRVGPLLHIKDFSSEALISDIEQVLSERLELYDSAEPTNGRLDH